MSFNCYKVAHLSELQPYREELRAILERLAGMRPEMIYALVNARRDWTSPDTSFRSALRRWLNLTANLASCARSAFGRIATKKIKFEN